MTSNHATNAYKAALDAILYLKNAWNAQKDITKQRMEFVWSNAKEMVIIWKENIFMMISSWYTAKNN